MPSKNMYADMLRQNELNYIKRLLNASDSAIPAGYLPEEGVTESTISPIDLIPWNAMAKMGAKGAKAAISAAPRIIGNEIGAVGSGVEDLARLARAKELAAIPQGPGMFRVGGESIPARELQLPNIKKEMAAAKNASKGSSVKELMGTSIGQGESVREGNISDAIEAAIRAIRYERSLPKPKLPK
jgi:hypothetical protein